MIDSVILHCLAEKEKEGEVREERCCIADLEDEGRDHKSKNGGRL